MITEQRIAYMVNFIGRTLGLTPFFCFKPCRSILSDKRQFELASFAAFFKRQFGLFEKILYI